MTNVLVLWADDRSPNFGVRVLGAGTEALARRVWPEASFIFYNYGARTAPVRLGSLPALGREAVTRRGGLGRWFATFDLVLDTRAGDSFADIYGLAGWRPCAAATEFAHRSGVPVVLSPQTIGPFASRAARAAGPTVAAQRLAGDGPGQHQCRSRATPSADRSTC